MPLYIGRLNDDRVLSKLTIGWYREKEIDFGIKRIWYEQKCRYFI